MQWSFAGFLIALGIAVSGCKPEATIASGTVGADTGPETVIRHTDPGGAEALLREAKVVVLDVRTPAEFGAGHIKGAKSLDFNASDFKSKLGELDRKQPYVVYCASGRRSTKSLELFKGLGFKEVTHLDGGFNAWKGAGKPVQP